jgi:hypothetical protein
LNKFQSDEAAASGPVYSGRHKGSTAGLQVKGSTRLALTSEADQSKLQKSEI